MNPAPPAPDARRVTVVNPHMLHVELEDGRSGTFDVAPLLAYPAYAALHDPGYFRRVAIEYGVVCWPDGEDLAPETVAARLVPDPEDRPGQGAR